MTANEFKWFMIGFTTMGYIALLLLVLNSL